MGITQWDKEGEERRASGDDWFKKYWSVLEDRKLSSKDWGLGRIDSRAPRGKILLHDQNRKPEGGGRSSVVQI